MANRFLSLKLAQNFRRQFTRHLNTVAAPSSISAVSPLNLVDKHDAPIVTPTSSKPNSHPDSIINLHDVKELYSSVPPTKLLRSAINLHAAAIEPMVNLGMKGSRSSSEKKDEMIEVVLNDRLGEKARVKCSEEDTIGDLKKLVATQTEKIRIQKWYNVYKDHITLADGMGLELYYDRSIRKHWAKRSIKVPAISNKLADIPPDEYSWRKYGQKPIKGSPHPRKLEEGLIISEGFQGFVFSNQHFQSMEIKSASTN